MRPINLVRLNWKWWRVNISRHRPTRSELMVMFVASGRVVSQFRVLLHHQSLKLLCAYVPLFFFHSRLQLHRFLSRCLSFELVNLSVQPPRFLCKLEHVGGRCGCCRNDKNNSSIRVRLGLVSMQVVFLLHESGGSACLMTECLRTQFPRNGSGSSCLKRA